MNTFLILSVEFCSKFLSSLSDFILNILACLCAIFLFWVYNERSKANISWISRLKDQKLNYLLIIHEQIIELRRNGRSDDEIYDVINRSFKNCTYLFMRGNTSEQSYIDAIAFVGRVIDDKILLFDYVADPGFNIRIYKRIVQLDNSDRIKLEAIFAVKGILVDKSEASINSAMKWIPALFTRPFIADPNDNENKITKTENHFSILFYLKGTYLEANTSQDTFIECLNKLKKFNPTMEFAASKGHSSDIICKLKQTDKRKDAIIAEINNYRHI